MGEAEAQKVALATFMVTAGVVGWDSLKKTGKVAPPFKNLVALLILGAVLGIGSSVAPQVFGPLTILVGLSVVLSKVGAKGAPQ